MLYSSTAGQSWLVLILSALCSCGIASAELPRYELKELKNLGAITFASEPREEVTLTINGVNQIAGSLHPSGTPGLPSEEFFIGANGYTKLKSPYNAKNIDVVAVNNAGTVLGIARQSNDEFRGILWQGTQLFTFRLLTQLEPWLQGIDGAGNVLGGRFLPYLRERSGRMTDLRKPAGVHLSTEPPHINARGDIAIDSLYDVIVLNRNKTRMVVPKPFGFAQTIAAFTDSGDIILKFKVQGPLLQRAKRVWSGYSMQESRVVNSFDDVTGATSSGLVLLDDGGHSSGRLLDLITGAVDVVDFLVSRPHSMKLVSALAMNERGNIAGICQKADYSYQICLAKRL